MRVIARQTKQAQLGLVFIQGFRQCELQAALQCILRYCIGQNRHFSAVRIGSSHPECRCLSLHQQNTSIISQRLAQMPHEVGTLQFGQDKRISSERPRIEQVCIVNQDGLNSMESKNPFVAQPYYNIRSKFLYQTWQNPFVKPQPTEFSAFALVNVEPALFILLDQIFKSKTLRNNQQILAILRRGNIVTDEILPHRYATASRQCVRNKRDLLHKVLYQENPSAGTTSPQDGLNGSFNAADHTGNSKTGDTLLCISRHQIKFFCVRTHIPNGIDKSVDASIAKQHAIDFIFYQIPLRSIGLKRNHRQTKSPGFRKHHTP